MTVPGGALGSLSRNVDARGRIWDNESSNLARSLNEHVKQARQI